MDPVKNEYTPTRELAELFTEGTEDILRALVTSNDEVPTLHIIRSEPRTGKTTKLPYALHLLSKEKVLCLQPTEHASVRVGSHAKQQFGEKHISFFDAWSSETLDDASSVVYVPVKRILAEKLRAPEAPIKIHDFSFVLFDEAHYETAEYELALTLLLSKQVTSSLRKGVKIILMSSFLRPIDQVKMKFEKLPAIRDHELAELREGGYPTRHYATKDMTLQTSSFISWVTRTLRNVATGIKAVVFVPYQDFRPVAIHIQEELRQRLRHCPPIYVKEFQLSKTPELLLGDDSFIARQVLCPHWKATREFDVEITKEVIDSRYQLSGSEFRFLESYASGDAEIFYSCSETTRTGVQPFIQGVVQTEDPLLYIFLASAIFPGSFTIDPVITDGADPADPFPVPWYFAEEAAVWALIRLGDKGYKLIDEEVAYGKQQLTTLGFKTARLLLYTDLNFYTSLLVASDTPANAMQLGWTLVAAIGASSGQPVLQLKAGEVKKPKKYSQLENQDAGTSLNDRRVMITSDHLKALGVLTAGTADMTKEQIEAAETDSTLNQLGDTFSDTAFLLSRLKQEVLPVTKPMGAQSFEYGAWVDTSEASNDFQSMLDRFERVTRFLGWKDPELHCLPFQVCRNGDSTAELQQQCGDWVQDFSELWLDVHMYNFAFVKVKKTMEEETGDSWTVIEAMDNVHFTAHDFCSGLEVHLDPKSTIHLSHCYLRFGFDEGFYVTYTTIRQVGNNMWQISGINCVNHAALKKFQKRILGVAPWVGGFSDVLLSTYKNPEWP